jgi:uncharacterized Zn finger protein (UPF0148 family)
MGTTRRSLLAAMGLLGTGGAAPAADGEPKGSASEPLQLIDHWIIAHGGDCCGCALSEPDGRIVCNECGEELDVLVSEPTLNRMAEALERAHHALTISSGLEVHDGKPEYCFRLDHEKELRFIEETLRLADIDPKPLEPLI